ncbi:MAG: hypothetical protein MJ132_04075 [Clostridia bacterium]|nr:hypothetical protein [Clostridia bacterium]
MNKQDIINRLQGNLNRYKPIPFWSWNAKLEPEELCRQIDWMKENEIGGYFMHARGGLKTEYLSEDWMQCIEACGEHGAKTDMDSWIYDENGWPSGFAGGKLLDDPENRDCYLEHTSGAFDPSATVSYLVGENSLERVSSGEQSGEYLNVFVRRATSTADILNPQVVDKFLDLTHRAYEKRLGKDFAKKYRGFFTDEPQYQRWGMPYSTVMEEYFKKTYNTDIFDELGLMFVEKEGYRKFRYRYWKAMQELMLRAFAEMTYNWCEENGVELTGHYVEEGTLGMQMVCCGGIMPFYEFEHIPGIDWLGRGTNNELPARQVASAAAQLGRRQILTESFGCCGWDVTPTDLKRIMEFQFVGGVNLLCHHLMPYAEYGQRKRDYPAHYSAVNPWVDRDFDLFNRYATRLGYMIAESDEAVNVAVLHPIRSVYFDYQRDAGSEGQSLVEYDQRFLKDLRSLSKHGLNYHFIDENLMARHGFVDGAQIGCGKCKYDYLVLPHVLTMDKTTENFLHEYVNNGGKVLILGEKPTYLEADLFAYDYLSANCTMDEILASQPCRATNPDTEFYSTYRVLGDDPFLFVANASQTNAYTQTYDLGEKVRSFIKFDLNDFSTERVPLTVTLDPAGSALLFSDDQPVDVVPQKTVVPFVMDKAKVSFDENSLTVDYVRYSTDGENFSELMPCIGLFDKLLKDRYEGPIWFRYEFDVHTVPKKIFLKAEKDDAVDYLLNGKSFAFTGHSPVENEMLIADISPLVQEGINTYTVRKNWYQSEDVYYALFGENVTESLRNCLVYDSELESVYITGQFGVYSVDGFTDDEKDPRYTFGNRFYIGELPETVTEPVYDGLPFFAGVLSATQQVTLDSADVMLQIAGAQLACGVTVNGNFVGELLFGNKIDIGKYAVAGENEIKLDFVISNRNLMGPHHFNGTDARLFVGPYTFELSGSWNEGSSPLFAGRYELLKLGCSK